jgi:DNA-binding CsgD family transcriptional regulator
MERTAARARAVGRPAEALMVCRLVEIDLADGDVARACQRLPRLDEILREGASPWLRAHTLRTRATATANAEGALEARRAALDEGLAFEAAASTLLLGDLRDDTALLLEAHDAFAGLGAEPWRRRTANELRKRGRAAPAGQARPKGGLSDTEQELARLVSSGLTNREIARALHFSPKTIEVYLSRLYEKTGCASRVELASAFSAGRLTTV